MVSDKYYNREIVSQRNLVTNKTKEHSYDGEQRGQNKLYPLLYSKRDQELRNNEIRTN
jgi:hypothetical protein